MRVMGEAHAACGRGGSRPRRPRLRTRSARARAAGVSSWRSERSCRAAARARAPPQLPDCAAEHVAAMGLSRRLEGVEHRDDLEPFLREDAALEACVVDDLDDLPVAE